MNSGSDDRWLLPAGIEEILPREAAWMEQLRRRLLDLYHGWGYELVIPPLVEYLDALLTGVGSDLELQTFKLTDPEGGRLLGVRPDMTPQVARIDAHYLRRRGPARLCYIGPVLRTHTAHYGGTREPIQVGAELFGYAGVDGDAEIIELMVATLGAAGIASPTIDLGHVGVVRGVLDSCGLEPADAARLVDAINRKSLADVQGLVIALDLSGPRGAMLEALVSLHGGASVIDRARQLLAAAGADVSGALDELGAVLGRVRQRLPGIEVNLDLTELRGARYHTGAVFAAYLPQSGYAVAQGGRYDNIGAAFGYARPATGFSIDLRALAHLLVPPTFGADAIMAPGAGDNELESLVAQLRVAGQRVVRLLEGMDEEHMREQCDRRIVRRGEGWAVETF